MEVPQLTALSRRLHDRFREEPRRVSEAREAMRRCQLAAGNLLAGEAIQTTLEPFFVDRHALDFHAAPFEALHQLIEVALEKLLEEDELEARLGLTPAHRALVRRDRGHPGPFLPVSRIDGMFVEGRGFQICELNTDGSTGLVDAVVLAEAAAETAVLREVTGDLGLSACPMYDHLAEAFRGLWASLGGEGNPRVAIADWDEVKTRHEQEVLAAELTTREVPAVRVDPRALEFRDGRLHAAGGPVDLVYKRVLTSELLARADEVADYLTAYREGRVHQLDPFAADLAYDKGFLALLGDPEFQSWMDVDHRILVDALVPGTRLYPAGPKLREEARARREELVLKPRREYGGRGVVLGPRVDDVTWCQALDTAAELGGYLLQDYLPPPRQLVWVPDREPGGHAEDLYTVVGNWMLSGELVGFYLRAGPDPVINVSSGAYSLPVVFVRPCPTRRRLNALPADGPDGREPGGSGPPSRVT